jgi:hypothetical protein
MKNLSISLPLVNGSEARMDFASGKELIQTLISDDWGAPPRCLLIKARSDDGTTVVISVPYSDSDQAHISVGKEES